jgi:hypothetical protein
MRNWGREERATGSARGTALPGVIDTLGYGYANLAGRPLAMLPLLLLELGLLFTPRVRSGPVVDGLAGVLRHDGEAWANLAAALERQGGFNVIEFASLRAPLVRVPAIVPALSEQRLRSAGWYASFSDLPWGVVVLIALGACCIGLALSVVFRALLATGVQDRRLHAALAPRMLARLGWRVLAWMAVLVGLGFLIAMPVVVVTVISMLFGYTGTQLLWLLLFIPAAWAFVHFYFSLHALFVDESGPLEALRSSYRVVQGHFWESIRFIVTTFLITTGLTYALQALSANIAGMLLAIGINAFVASGIIVAAMLFYRDRARRLGLPGIVAER